MLSISELVALAQTLDPDGSSPIAVALAEAWGSGRVCFVRSSANHVFFCGDSLVLRFRPRDRAAGMEETAQLARRLTREDAPVARAIAARDGRTVVWDSAYAGHAVERVYGEQLDAGALTRAQARSWGRGLAGLHEAAAATSAQGLPSWLESVRAADGPLAEELDELPTTRAVAGVVHGDPELDNVLWRAPDEPVFVDLDEAAYSWFASDVCFALRDFASAAEVPDPAHEPVASFIAGYREARPLTDEELSWLPLFARAHAAVALARIRETLAEPAEPDWPVWALALRERVEQTAARLESALAAGTIVR